MRILFIQNAVFCCALKGRDVKLRLRFLRQGRKCSYEFEMSSLGRWKAETTRELESESSMVSFVACHFVTSFFGIGQIMYYITLGISVER